MKTRGETMFWILAGFVLAGVVIGIVELALAQTTKGRAKVDATKKWELLHDATGQVLASCDAQLTCTVSDQLKQMIACHDQMQQAMQAVAPYLSKSGDGANVDAVYHSPSTRMRMAAEAIDRQDAAVTMFRSIMTECGK